MFLFPRLCHVCHVVLSSGVERGADEGTRVSILPQYSGEMVLFLPQVALPDCDGSGSVQQAPDQSPLDLGWIVGVRDQVPVHMRWFSVDSDVQAAIISPLEQGVEKG